MFMQLAIGAIGIGVVVMVGYLVISNVKDALPDTFVSVTNVCFNETPAGAACNASCGSNTDNTSATVSCKDTYVEGQMNSAQTTVYAGFALVAVGIIVLAAFGLIAIFK